MKLLEYEDFELFEMWLKDHYPYLAHYTLDNFYNLQFLVDAVGYPYKMSRKGFRVIPERDGVNKLGALKAWIFINKQRLDMLHEWGEL